MNRRKQWLASIGGMLLLSILEGVPVMAQSPVPAPAPAQPLPALRIATRLVKPDVFEENDQLVGFSIDLERSILEQLQRQGIIETYADVPQLLTAIQSGQVDMGIAAITITQQRDQEFDFSHPILVAGLQVMVLAPKEQIVQTEQELWQRLRSAQLLRLFGAIALLMLIPVHIVWYFERRNPDNGLVTITSYIPGIFQALWWTILTLVGQAGEMPKGTITRIVALFWIFIGIVFTSYFTANITTELTTQELRGSIQDLNDLEDRPVAVLTEDQAKDYLYSHNISQVIEFSGLEQAYEALVEQTVDAVIAPSPLLLHFATHEQPGKVQVVGTPFRKQFYSIVMPKDSPYRRLVNQAILALKENGTYQAIYRKWFGTNPQEDVTVE